MEKKNQQINMLKLQGLKHLNKQADIKKVYTQKNLCGVNAKFGPPGPPGFVNSESKDSNLF